MRKRKESESIEKERELTARVRMLESEVERLINGANTSRSTLKKQNEAILEARQSLEEARDQYANLYDHSPAGYLTMDEHGVIHNLNLTAAKLLDMPREVIKGTPFAVWVRQEDISVFFKHLTLAKAGSAHTEIGLVVKKFKHYVVTLDTVFTLDSPEGCLRLQTVMVDITSRKHAELELLALNSHMEVLVRERTAELRESNRALVANRLRERALLDSIPDFAWLKDCSGRYMAINKALSHELAFSSDELIGKSDADIWSAETAERNRADEVSVLLSGRSMRVEEHLIDKLGKGVFVESIKVPIFDDQNDTVGIACVARDMSERRAAQERIHYLAHYDVLTGLPNRTLLNERFERALASARRNSEHLAVLFIDLDRFKTVNDTFGHAVGDELLKVVAARMMKCIRETDTAGRFGGDEFIVICSQLSGIGDAVEIVRKMLAALAEPYVIDGEILDVTPSIGVSLFPQDGADAESLIRMADTALYRAKHDGRNNFRFFDSQTNTLVMGRAAMEKQLRSALANDEFELHYQPIFGTEDGKLVGMEALIRMRDGDGTILPERFIPIAEDSGLITAIGSWVLSAACQQNRSWQNEGFPSVPVSVNLSGIQFRQLDFFSSVTDALLQSNLDAKYLELELTETIIMNNSEVSVRCLEDLRSLGVKISIDDFGTGYSSLSYLQNFPIDKIKIDRSFIHELCVNNKTAAMTEAIINMAKLLKVSVTAEGVETLEELEILQAQHCDYVQGNYLSTPLHPEKMSDFLRAS